ncbi:hypothetical protein CAPTEDRAFT_162655 [Capitella teleta]|uniref:Mannose-P-dolichol utilization defect 1 protein homolog n=1 Tax=Capitella teleta TaxID=283909 RepID=R7V1F4_CAPTE|nr:hypothetical protein CAPTEDRAFT_162655 [Capitella teleta]|eukprot:ELU12384.1 hypothetical protein CAPTEDRAFT_162655 [Capitella teleta]
MAFLDVVRSLLLVVISPQCFDKFFEEFDFLDGPCLKMTISKCLGYGIILGSLLVKVPQLVKILGAKSAEGISIISTTLELLAVVSTLCYSYSKNYPFSSYGDSVFLLLQTAAIAFLVLFYGGRPAAALAYTAALAASVAVLMSPVAPEQVLWAMQASVLLTVICARSIQAFANFRNGHTGQLSIVTFLLLFFGSLARIFTSIQETGDSTIVANYVASTLCNAMIVAQIFYYWSSTQKKLKKA